MHVRGEKELTRMNGWRGPTRPCTSSCWLLVVLGDQDSRGCDTWPESGSNRSMQQHWPFGRFRTVRNVMRVIGALKVCH
jgi:hypothetical protein